VATNQKAGDASGTITPFTLPNLISQLRMPLTKSTAITVPPAQPLISHEPRLTQSRSTRPRDDSEERDTLVGVVQRLQERVAYLEGRPSGDRVGDRRRRRTSTLSPSLGEDAFGSEGTADPPPTYTL
jgi:hypothetical protein